MPEKRSSDTEALLHRALADPSRVGILAALEQAPEPPDASQLARAVGLHVNTVRSHLRQLEEAGLVRPRRDAQGKPGRPHMVFEATGVALDPPKALEAYRMLASVLARSMASDGVAAVKLAETAGSAVARELAPEQPGDGDSLGHVMRFLARLGFDPETRAHEDGPTEIVMRACPFEDLSPESLEVACSVHRGLIRGALAPETSATSTVVELHPEPGSCVARLAAVS